MAQAGGGIADVEPAKPTSAHEGESKTAVIAAMGANLAIALGKLIAGIMTGSAALLAEAGHSFADTVNQVFLLIGINLSHIAADERHPHGYGKEAFFWSFLAAIFIFVAGATFSLYEGIRTAVEGHHHDRSSFELAVAYGVLGMAVVFESASFTVAIRGLLAAARSRGWSFRRTVTQSPDVTIKTVFFEDSAALIGLSLALGGLTMTEVTGSENWDAAASIAIGFVLAGVAFMLGLQSRNLLLGASAPPEVHEKLDSIVNAFPEVDGIERMLTMQMGAHSILVTGDIRVKREMTTNEIEELILRVDREISRQLPEVVETFWELHSNEARPDPLHRLHVEPEDAPADA